MSRHTLTARIAYEIFLQRGGAHGRHLEDWRAAETIVALCLAFAAELYAAQEAAREDEHGHEEAEAEATRLPSPEERALELLERVTAELGRSAVADKLGYKSAGTVGRYLRGDRPIGERLAAKILARLGEASGERRARRAA